MRKIDAEIEENENDYKIVHRAHDPMAPIRTMQRCLACYDDGSQEKIELQAEINELLAHINN